MKRKAESGLRRRPSQKRSRQKLDALFQACGRVLARHGYEGATTTVVAKAAKMPVGTLYEYFPNRETLFRAYLEWEMERVMASVEKMAPLQKDRKAGDILHDLVGVAVRAVLENRNSIRVLLLTLPGGFRLSALSQFEKRVEGIARFVSWMAPEQVQKKDFPLRLYVLSNAVLGFLLRLAAGDRPKASAEEITTELVKLIRSYTGL